MVNENRVLMDAVKIFQIRYQNQRKNTWETNKNFEEFRMVYQGIIKNKVVPNRYVRERSPIPIKTVTIELPTLGSEKAILPPKIKKKVLKPILKKKIETKEAETVTLDIVEKLSILEANLKGQESQKQIQKSPSGFIDKTNKELRIAEEQLNQLKNIMLERQEKTRKIKSPSFKLKNKATKHHDCISKKYISTLSNMKQTLKKLEQKYFEKPRIIYKDVNHTFTQSKSVEILYENQKYPEDCKMDDALKGIISELDELASGEMKGTFSNPRNITFKQPMKKDPIARTIEMSEAHLKQLRHFKQDIKDVEEFCDKICNLSKSDTLSEEETTKDCEDREYWKNQLLNYTSQKKNVENKWNISTLLYEEQKGPSSKIKFKNPIIDSSEAPTKIISSSKNIHHNAHNFLETFENKPHNSTLPLGSFGDQNDYEDSEIQKLAMKSAFWIEQVSKKRDSLDEASDEAMSFHVPGDSWNSSLPIKTFYYCEEDRKKFIENTNEKIFLHKEVNVNIDKFKNRHVLTSPTLPPKLNDFAETENFPTAHCQKNKSPTFNIKIADNDDIQTSVMKSCYLMKEFNINPTEKALNMKKTETGDVLTKYI